MKLLDKLMSVKSKDGDTAPAASPAPEPGNGVADLWFSLCDDPNQQDRLPELLTLCAKKGGPAASRAALGELAGIKGSWLPQRPRTTANMPCNASRPQKKRERPAFACAIPTEPPCRKLSANR